MVAKRSIVRVTFVTDDAATVNSLVCPVVKTSLARVSMATWMLIAPKNRTENSDRKFAGVLERMMYFVIKDAVGSVRVTTIPQPLMKRISCVNQESWNKIKPESSETEPVYA